MPRKKKAEPRETWERSEKETDIEWSYFQCYRDMGGARRQSKTAAKMQKSVPVIQKCATKHTWASRCFDFDLHRDRIAVEAEETEIKKMRVRHIQLSNDIQTIAAMELKKRMDMAAYDGLPTIKVAELTAMLKHGTELERLTQGEPTDIPGAPAVDYSKLSTQDLKDLQRITNKAKGG